MNDLLEFGIILIVAAIVAGFGLMIFKHLRNAVLRTLLILACIIMLVMIYQLLDLSQVEVNGGMIAFVYLAVLVVCIGLYRMITSLINASNSISYQSLREQIGEIIGQGVIITDSAGNIIDTNSCLTRMCGYSRQELLNKNVIQLVQPLGSNEESSYEYFLNYSKNAHPDRDNCRIRKSDGTLKPLKMHSGRYTHNSQGYSLLFFSEHPVYDARAARLNELRSLYFEFAPVILLALDNKGVVIMINDYGCDVLGLPESAVLRARWFRDFTPPSEADKNLSVFQDCLAGKTVEAYDSRLFSSTLGERLIRWNLRLFLGGDDFPACVLFSGQDITDGESEHVELLRSLENVNTLRQRLEERVAERTRELEDININLKHQIDERRAVEDRLVSNQRLHNAVVDNFPNGLIAVVNPQLEFIMVNGMELNVLGLSKENLVGRYIFAPPESLLPADAKPILEKAFRGESGNFEAIKGDYIYNINVVPLPDGQNKIDEVLVVLHNITENKRLEEGLYKTIEEEKKLNDLKSRFVTMASHEFRTPLSTILSSVFLMENYSGELYEEKKRVHLNRIKRTVNVLTETLNDFLRLGKLEEGLINIILNEINLEEEIQDIVTEMRPLLRPGQEITVCHYNERRNILLDRYLLRSIVTNLLSNAVKYSYDNGLIILETTVTDSRMVIKVVDHGIGIAEEERHHIFQRFFRAFNALNIEGTGLGLHIVKRYVDLMNGTIDFVSGNNGTTFTVDIPLQQTQDKSRLILK